jgi:cyclic pyranopterin phosphate synthase
MSSDCCGGSDEKSHVRHRKTHRSLLKTHKSSEKPECNQGGRLCFCKKNPADLELLREVGGTYRSRLFALVGMLRSVFRRRLSTRVASRPRVEALRSRLAEEASTSLQDFASSQQQQQQQQQRSHIEWRRVLEQQQQQQQQLARATSQRASLADHAPSRALFDRYERHHTYLRMSLTERCSLRCVYCMPEDGVSLTPQAHLLSAEEAMRLARVFVGAGVTKIRLTGGEPTVRRDLPEVVAALNDLRPLGLREIAMTSNGIALPRMLPSLVANGLDRLNLSLDTLDRTKFAKLTRRDGLARVHRAIDLALELGIAPLKLNCVLMAGTNDDELLDFARLSVDRPIDVRFIEYMPFDGNRWSENSMVPFEHMLQRVEEAYPGLERLPTPPNDVAVSWRLPEAVGSVSFIASMTQPFCAGCNRLRLTADGNIKVCLFGNAEISLRDAMREGATDEELLYLVGGALAGKHAAHAGMHAIAATENRPMTTIGG